MAQTLYCDDHPGQVGVMLVTNLQSGEVVTLCANCVGPWCLALAQAVMPDAFQDIALTATVDAAAGEEGEAAQDPPRPKRRRGGRQSGPGEAVEQDRSDIVIREADFHQVPTELQAPSSPFPDIAADDS